MIVFFSGSTRSGVACLPLLQHGPLRENIRHGLPPVWPHLIRATRGVRGGVRDTTGSYDAKLYVAIGLLITGAMMLLGLGHYPDLHAG